MFDKISDLLIRLAALGLIIMTAVIFWQVFGRFVLDSSPSWSEQMALILMIWYILFAAAAGVKEGFHIKITVLEDMSSRAFARKLRICIHIIVAFFGAILFIYGAQLVYLVQIHVIPALGISRGFAYLPLPIAGFLMAIFAMRHAIAEWRNTALAEPTDNGPSARVQDNQDGKI